MYFKYFRVYFTRIKVFVERSLPRDICIFCTNYKHYFYSNHIVCTVKKKKSLRITKICEVGLQYIVCFFSLMMIIARNWSTTAVSPKRDSQTANYLPCESIRNEYGFRFSLQLSAVTHTHNKYITLISDTSFYTIIIIITVYCRGHHIVVCVVYTHERTVRLRH